MQPAEIGSGGLRLIVPGIKAGVVRNVYDQQDLRRAPLRDWLQWAQKGVVAPGRDSMEVEEILWNNEFLGLFGNLVERDVYKGLYRIDSPSLVAIRKELQRWLLLAKSHGDNMRLKDLGFSQSAWSGLFPSIYGYLSLYRVMVSTDRGKVALMGLANLDIMPKPGDQIWIIAGCPQPLILRPKANGHSQDFVLIGPADIPHISDGTFYMEYWQSKRAEGVPNRNIFGMINLV